MESAHTSVLLALEVLRAIFCPTKLLLIPKDSILGIYPDRNVEKQDLVSYLTSFRVTREA